MLGNAWFVARGLGQRACVDSSNRYSPRPSVASIRLLKDIACELGLVICRFDAAQAFVQSTLSKDVCMRLPKGSGSMSSKAVNLRRSLYGVRQASRRWHHHLVRGMRGVGFEHFEDDACDMRLMEAGAVTIVVIVVVVEHADGIPAMGLKRMCDKHCEDRDQFVRVNDLGALRWYAGCRFSPDWDSGTLTTS